MWRFLTENLKEISKAVQLLVTKKTWSSKRVFFYLMMKIFTRVQKINWISYNKIFNFNFSTHIIPTMIFIFLKNFQKKSEKIIFTELD